MSSRRIRWMLVPATTALAVIFFLAPPSPDPQPRLRKTSHPSHAPTGSLASLDGWSASRAYPNRVMPDVGHAAAHAEMKLARRGGTIDDALAPWSSLGPNNIGGRTLALAVRPDDPDVIFAGSASGGLWRTTTGGVGADAWDRVATGFSESAVGAIALDPVDPDVMYVGTGEVYGYQSSLGGDVVRTTRGSYGIGILKSTDAGSSWVKSLDWTLQQTRGVQVVRVDPVTTARVYAGTSEGIYRSTDAGDTWTNVHSVLMCTDLRVHPGTPSTILAACGNLGSAGTGLYRSTDGGDTWVQLGGGLPASWTGKALLDIAPSSPNVVYASIGNDLTGRGLWKSTNTGTSWTNVNSTDFQQYQGFYAHWVLADPANANRVFMGGIEIWRSTNGGSSISQRSQWTQVFIGSAPPAEGPIGGAQYAHADHHAAVWHPSQANTVFFASDGGVFKTTDGGTTFQSLIGGYTTTQFYNGFSVSASDPDLSVGGMQDNFTNIHEGTDEWRRVIGGDGGWSAIHPNDDDTIFATYQYLGVVRSFDRMNSWSFVEPPEAGSDVTSFIAPLLLSRSNPTILYGGRSRIYKSSNSASSWSATNQGSQIDGGNPMLSMAMSSTHPDTVYAGTAPLFSRARIFRTTNGGFSYVDVTGTLPDRYPMDIAVDPSDSRIVYVAFSGFGSSHLYGSSDAGATWSDLGAGLPDVPASAIEVDPDDSDVLYFGNDLGVWLSVDRGSTWQSFGNGMPTALVNDLKVFAPTRILRAATHGNGAWERTLFDPAAVSAPLIAHAALGLSIRPNPARGAVRVEFELSRVAKIELALYDVAGRKVRAIVEGTRTEGRHAVELNPSGLAPGVYFARLVAGRSIETTRFTYVR